MDKDRDRWNARFSSRTMTQASVPKFIEARLSQFVSGTVLDIASGDGAASLYIAENGFNVTALDISDVALKRLADFAQRKNLRLVTCLADLDQENALGQLGAFDNIVMTHFKPKAAYWPAFVSLLRPSGRLFLSTFNWLHHLNNNFSRRFCLEENELFKIHSGLELEYHASVIRNGNYMDDYQFRRI